MLCSILDFSDTQALYSQFNVLSDTNKVNIFSGVTWSGLILPADAAVKEASVFLVKSVHPRVWQIFTH